jgi:hypothetical protein
MFRCEAEQDRNGSRETRVVIGGAQPCEDTMRTTILILGLLLAATACSKRNTDSGRQYSELPSGQATMSAPAPPAG